MRVHPKAPNADVVPGTAGAGRRARPRRGWRGLLLCTATTLTLLAGVLPATVAAADPANPSDRQIADAQAAAQANATELGRLTGVLAGIDGDIARLGIAAQEALDRYDRTTQELIAALDAVTQAQSGLDAAHAAEAAAREQLRQLARRAYMSAPTATAGGLLVAQNPNEAVEALDTRRFIAQRQSEITSAVSAAVVASSNAEASRRSAQQAAERLQAQAAVDKDAAITILRENEAKRAALDAQRVQANAAAAAAAVALSGLQDQRAAYDAWAAEQARQAELERQRQAAIAAERDRQRVAAQQEQQRLQASAPPPSAVSTGGDGASTYRPPIASYAPPADGASWVPPLSPGSYYISSCFCARWGSFHDGDDLAAALGTPIMAIGAGRVVAAGPASGFGNWVVIDHGNGAYSIYGHMRILTVSVGQTVSPGQLIAYVGSEGQSTGPHLHLSIRLGGISGPAVDPEVWLALRGVYL